jgi:hypothetical protein
VFGNPDTAYVALEVNYDPMGTASSGSASATSSYYQVLTDRSNAIQVVAFLQSDIVPLLNSNFPVKSFLLLDSLNSAIYGTFACKGYNTVALGAVPWFAEMDSATRDQYKAAVMQAIVSPTVLNYTSYLNSYFYDVSRTYVAGKISWATDVYTDYLTLSTMQSYGINTFQDAGFLDKNTSIDDYGYPQPPTSTLDVIQYVGALFTYTSAEFSAKYGQYPLVIKKFNSMKSLLTGLGFSFD